MAWPVIAEIAALCIGSALSGGLVTALVSPFLNRRRNKLDEADIMSRISTQLREELLEDKEKQDKTIGALRKVIISLTDLLDDILPRVDGITDDEKRRLRSASVEARLTGLAA